jgi:hypothetical protein
MHVGDLDGSSAPAPRNHWNANVTITVHDANENPVANATVSGTWSAGTGGSDSCTNHDPDGDSNGTSIVILQP